MNQNINIMNKSHQKNVENLRNIFKRCLNILRDNEHLTGYKALRTLANFLVIRLIEDILNDIKIDEFKYPLNDFTDEQKEIVRSKLLKYTRFSNLSELMKNKEDNIPKTMEYIWEYILSEHPITSKIFIKGQRFNITHKSTYSKIFKIFNGFDFSSVGVDIQGEAYEEVVKDIMTGKVLGQYFTPPIIKEFIINKIKPKLNKDGTTETIFDPALGTGGFLLSSLKYFVNESKNKKIKLNYEFSSKIGLGGREPEPDTYQLAMSNMLISTGHIFETLEKGDSIRSPIENKYDIIVTNPPFGIDGLNYEEIQPSNILRDEYLPIKSSSAVPLFLQAIIYMLKINGRCGVVLPDGQELFNKKSSLVAMRKLLLKTCDLEEIVLVPRGIFTNTSIKTCIFFFTKKKEVNDVLELKIKISKSTQQETSRKYKFTNDHSTEKVKFSEFNPEQMDCKEILIVPIDEISSNNYSLNYQEYIKEEEKKYDNSIEVKTLGEVCNINQGKNLTKKKMVPDGNYDVIGGGKIIGKHDEFNRNGNEIVLTRVGDININYIYNKYYLTDNGFSISSSNNKYLTKYIYYYLLFNKDIIRNKYKGTAQKVISKTNLKLVNIPIPSLERQNEMVKQLDYIYEECIETSLRKIDQLNRLNGYYLQNQIRYGDNETKMLGKVCEFIKTGKNKTKDNKKGTLYPYYGTGSITGYTDDFLYDGKYLLTARNGTIGNCFITNGRFFPSDHIFVICITDKTLLKFVYYLLLNNNNLIKLATGVTIPNITKHKLEKFKIPIPPLERQKEIVNYFENNEDTINKLQKEIEGNKKLVSNIINSINKLEEDNTTDEEECTTDEE
jgi:type I restriction-modification system DNA methylase subunit/restriction endonuclease S subunit